MSKKKDILVLITHSLGEFDVLLPMLSVLDRKYRSRIEIVIGVREIYQSYLNCGFYQFCEKKLDLSVSYQQLQNKFDHRGSWMRKHLLGRILLQMFFFLKNLQFMLIVRVRLNRISLLMHETTNQLSNIFLLSRFLKKTTHGRIVYHHGHSLNQVARDKKVRDHSAGEALYLIFTDQHKEWAINLGYPRQSCIGFPKLYSEWTKITLEYKDKTIQLKRKEYVLIYSRGVSEIYMDSGEYENLLQEAYSCVREIFGNVLIVIKPHPREDHQVLEEVIVSKNMENIMISTEHASVLAVEAILCISLWTSCVFDSLAVDTPVVEYYREAVRFREIEPLGSPYKIAGIDTVDTKEGLRGFMLCVRSGEYITPNILDVWKKDSSGYQITAVFNNVLSKIS